MTLGILADLPAWFWQVPYVGDRFPGNVSRSKVGEGANCQLWAYEVIAHFGLHVPDLRSDDLWHDVDSTRLVNQPEPLDLVLYNSADDPYGAHVGVWTGDGVAHLCREVGRPVVWGEADFSSRERYSTCIGFKRPTGADPD